MIEIQFETDETLAVIDAVHARWSFFSQQAADKHSSTEYRQCCREKANEADRIYKRLSLKFFGKERSCVR